MKLKSATSRLTTLSLGSNLGERLANLQAARDRLRTLADPARPFLQAPVYQTCPIGCPPGSPDFLNSVVAFHFNGGPHDLLAASQSIESDLGRPDRRATNAPRPIDIDILTFGADSIASPALTIPHPRIRERRFVLHPLADILPELVLPGDSRNITGLLDRLSGDHAPLSLVRRSW